MGVRLPAATRRIPRCNGCNELRSELEVLAAARLSNNGMRAWHPAARSPRRSPAADGHPYPIE